MTEALKRYDELGEHCYAQRNPAIGEDTLTEYINLAWDSMLKFKGERSTWTTWDRQIWDEIFITQYIRSIAKDWYTWLLEHTSGNAKSRLREIAELDKGKSWQKVGRSRFRVRHDAGVFRPNRRHQRNQNGEKTLKPVSLELSGQNSKIFEAKKLNQRPAKCAIGARS